MSTENVLPVAPAERIEVLDVLRGFAVCGILIGNLQWFSGYGMMPAGLAEQAPAIDKVTHFLVHFFIEGKFYSIFSFLFGVGFAIQIARAEDRGDTKISLFKRRLFWLLVIGLLHAYLLWAGDILSIYALMGFLLLLFRKKSDASLLKWSVWLMVVPVVTYALLLAAFLTFAPADASTGFQATQDEMWNNNIEQVRSSSFFEILTGYNLYYVIGRYLGLIFQMRLPKILAMFLLGVYAYRKGLFQNPSTDPGLVKKVMAYGLLLGLVGNALMSALSGTEAALPPSVAGFGGRDRICVRCTGFGAWDRGVGRRSLGKAAVSRSPRDIRPGGEDGSYKLPDANGHMCNHLLWLWSW